MAARVGSVVVDLVANTAQFESGMKQAAVTAQTTDKVITQKAWAAAHSTDRMSEAMDRFDRRSMGASATLEGTTARMIAQRFGAGGLTSALFTLDTAYARLAMRARDASAAIGTSATAMGKATTAAKILTATFAPMVAKIAIVVGALWGMKKLLDLFNDWRQTIKDLDPASEAFTKGEVERAREVYDGWHKTRTEFDELIEAYEAGTVKAGTLGPLVAGLIGRESRAETDRMERDAFERGRAIQTQITRGIHRQSMQSGWDWFTGADFSDELVRTERINQHFDDMVERAREIEHVETRRFTLEMIAHSRRVAMARELQKIQDEKTEAEEKAHQTRMEQIREQARELSGMFGRAAGLVTGFGQEAWKAVQESARQLRSHEAQKRMLEFEGAGALDQEDKRNLQSIRDSLLELLRMEPVSI